jgi:replicative DNA helicase
MALGGYSGKAPEEKQIPQEDQTPVEERSTYIHEEKLRKDAEEQYRIQQMYEQFRAREQELYNRIAQIENERIMLLRILDSYSQTVAEIKELKANKTTPEVI